MNPRHPRQKLIRAHVELRSIAGVAAANKVAVRVANVVVETIEAHSDLVAVRSCIVVRSAVVARTIRQVLVFVVRDFEVDTPGPRSADVRSVATA